MKQFISNYLDDILFFIGLVVITIATYRVSPTAAMFVVGAIFVIGALLIGLKGNNSGNPPGP